MLKLPLQGDSCFLLFDRACMAFTLVFVLSFFVAEVELLLSTAASAWRVCDSSGYAGWRCVFFVLVFAAVSNDVNESPIWIISFCLRSRVRCYGGTCDLVKRIYSKVVSA